MSETGAFKPVDDLLEGLVADKNGLPGAVAIVLNREGSDFRCPKYCDWVTSSDNRYTI